MLLNVMQVFNWFVKCWRVENQNVVGSLRQELLHQQKWKRRENRGEEYVGKEILELNSGGGIKYHTTKRSKFLPHRKSKQPLHKPRGTRLYNKPPKWKQFYTKGVQCGNWGRKGLMLLSKLPKNLRAKRVTVSLRVTIFYEFNFDQ